MRIFVTGSAGFIGSHLCYSLKKRGDTVLGYDNFNNYYDPKLKKARAQWIREVGVDTVLGDLLDYANLEATIKDFAPTHIVHLAAQAGVRYSVENPTAYVQSNIQGFLHILEVCKRFPNVPLTYASSSSVYGVNSKVPFSEKDRCDSQASFYGVTKKTNELMAETYHRMYGIKVTGLRFFTVYGPMGRPDMAPFIFTNKIINDEPIDLYNYGNMERDFTYIDDIVDGIQAAINYEGLCECFNLGNNTPEKLGTFIELLEKYIEKKAKKNLLPMQLGDVPRTYADIEHSYNVLGYKPKVSLEEGLKAFITWWQQKACVSSL